MGQIFVTTYEVGPAGMDITQSHLDAQNAYRERGIAAADKFGATGFRPRRYGPPTTLMFKAESAPTGFKLVKRERAGVIECSPRMTTALGKEAKSALAEIGIEPSGEDLAAAFGWNPSELAMDTDRGTIYFPTTLSTVRPIPRHFVRLPRFAADGWEGHPGLAEIAESAFMRAIEDHNAAARLQEAA